MLGVFREWWFIPPVPGDSPPSVLLGELCRQQAPNKYAAVFDNSIGDYEFVWAARNNILAIFLITLTIF